MKIKVDQTKPLYFTSDEHYSHYNVIKYNSRPYKDIDEMDADLIRRFNEKVPKTATTIHAGDFTLNKKRSVVDNIISKLNGKHEFIIGSHDYWMKPQDGREIIEFMYHKQPIVVCHYAMRVWPRSHYNSWLLYGHSHGGLPGEGKSYDVGVDNNWYDPVSFEEIVEIMSKQPDNFNLVRDRRY